MKKFALIVGGGQGLRFGGEIPKQFLLLCDKPVIFHTIEKFLDSTDQIILVLPESHFSLFESLRIQYPLSRDERIKLVAGGASRTESVMNGLQSIDEEAVVAIHDAVRPLVSIELIEALLTTAIEKGNAVPFVSIKDSLRMRTSEGFSPVNRDDFIAIQTPQCFHASAIRSAYINASSQSFTDDASLFESAGNHINLVEGETSNIKITWPEDLAFAESVFSKSNQA